MYFDTKTGTCQLISAEHCPENDIINCYDNKDQTRISQWACQKIVMLNKDEDCIEGATDKICKSPLVCANGKCQCLNGECNTDDIGNKKYLCEIKDCISHATKTDNKCECDDDYYYDESTNTCAPFDKNHCGYDKQTGELIDCEDNKSNGAKDIDCTSVGLTHTCTESCKEGYVRDTSKTDSIRCTGCQSNYHKSNEKCIQNEDTNCGYRELNCHEINNGYQSTSCNINAGNNATCNRNIVCQLGYELSQNNTCIRYDKCEPQFIYDGNVADVIGQSLNKDEVQVFECAIGTDDDRGEEIALDNCFSKTSCPYYTGIGNDTKACKTHKEYKEACGDDPDCKASSSTISKETAFAALYSPGCPSGFVCETDDTNIQYCDRPSKIPCEDNTTCTQIMNNNNYFCAWNGHCQYQGKLDNCAHRIIKELVFNNEESKDVCETQPLFCNLDAVKSFFTKNTSLEHALLDAYANDVDFSNEPQCNKYLRLRSFFKHNTEAKSICDSINNNNNKQICKSPEDFIRCTDLLVALMYKLTRNIMLGADYNGHTADITTYINIGTSLNEAYRRPEWQYIEQPTLCIDADYSSTCDGDDVLYCACDDETKTPKDEEKSVKYQCKFPEHMYLQTCETRGDCIYGRNCINGFCLDEPEYCTAEVYWKLFENKTFEKKLEAWIKAEGHENLCSSFKDLIDTIKNIAKEKLHYNEYCDDMSDCNYRFPDNSCIPFNQCCGKMCVDCLNYDEFCSSSDLEKGECVQECPNGMFPYNGVCINPPCKNGMLYMNCSKMFTDKIDTLPDTDVSHFVRFMSYSIDFTDKFEDWSGDNFKCPF